MEKDKYFYIKKFVNGGISGSIGKTIVAPLDRIKIIFMVKIYKVSKRKFTYREGFFEARNIIREKGLKSMYRGNLVTCYRIFPSSAFVIGII